MSITTRLMKITSVFLSLATVSAFAGGMEGGGGKGILCGNKLRTLDIYESEEIYSLPPVHKFSTIDKNLEIYGSPLSVYWSRVPANASDENIQMELKKDVENLVISRFRDIPPDTTLPLTNDASLPQLPSNCSVVQIAVYSDQDNVVYRDLKLWEMLDAHGQTSLLLHELYYLKAREVHAKTSDDVRRMIGLAMHDKLPEPLYKPFWTDSEYLKCIGGFMGQGNGLQSFTARNYFKNGKSGVEIYFGTINDKFITFRTTTFLENITISTFTAPIKRYGLSILEDNYTNSNYNFEFKNSTTTPYMTDVRVWPIGQVASSFTRSACEIIKN